MVEVSNYNDSGIENRKRAKPRTCKNGSKKARNENGSNIENRDGSTSAQVMKDSTLERQVSSLLIFSFFFPYSFLVFVRSANFL